jgi:dienelactone hydrolase
MLVRSLLLAFCPVLLLAQPGDPALARRKESLDLLLKLLPRTSTRITGRINASDKSWEDWVARTGELPPDFASMPSNPALPDPLEGVTTRAQWTARKKWIREQFEHWVTGNFPPAPTNLRAVITNERKEGGVTVRDVRLEFGPDHKAMLRVQLMIPPGKGPFPVFMTNHPRTRPWVATAVRRGYIGAIYFAADPIYGSEDDSDKFIDVYDYDFSCTARWAWAGMRTVDYLYTLPEVDKQKIAITGHSRNGKQALIAAAFDERITAVIPSSGNTGECDPWRYATDMFANETIEQITGSFPHWFHPRLRFFAGHEDKLPVDQNLLMALVAPRALYMYSAFSESQGNSFGMEQAYRSVSRVYRFLGAPEKLGLHLRAGEHPTTAGDIENFVDFLDSAFGRRPARRFETTLHNYNYEHWKEIAGAAVKPPSPDASREEKIRWALGDEPAGLRYPARERIAGSGMTNDGWLGILFNRPVKIPGANSAPIAFGDDLRGELYYPENATAKMPVVVWLHPFSYPTGYSRYARQQFAPFLKRGFAVFAFDQIGFGTRVEHAKNFYDRYPQWSLLGKMTADTRAAVDALAAVEELDGSRIYLAGYALGGKVALWTAAIEPRVKAVVSIAGFTPLRSAGKDLEGIAQYSRLHGLAPRLGMFESKPAGLPVDYDDLLAAAAPRAVLVVSPTLDHYADAAAVRRAVERAGAHVQLETPVDFNRLPAGTLDRVSEWIAAH